MGGRGQELYRHAKQRLPGGTQLLSKRPEMFLPDLWPAYYSRANGVDIWDLDGNHFLDMSYHSIGACVLGAADPDVNAAVQGAIECGSMSTLNAPEEVELADLLCELHPWAEKVRFGRSGGEASVIAIRVARAYTGRDKVAFCGYHGWHDWYLAANLAESKALDGHLLSGLSPAGVPRGLLGTTLPFHYNKIDELHAIAKREGSDLAAIIMEPRRDTPPDPGFLEAVREIADNTGAVLIFDEITAGFRLNSGGVHLLLGVEPDMAIFAKAMSNGFPMAAIIGRGDVMSAAEKTFISSTYWTERVGPVAALATIRKHIRHDVSKHLVRMGNLMIEGWKTAAKKAGVAIHAGGLPPLAHFSFDDPDGQEAATFFTQSMLGKGYLANRSFYATFAHTDAHVSDYMVHAEATLREIAEARQVGGVTKRLKGPVAHSGFSRLT